MKKITFGIANEFLWLDKTLHPQPISEYIPDWFKKVPAYGNNEGQYHKYNSKLKTIKGCPSFIDIFQEGYVILNPTDIILAVQKSGDWAWEVPFTLQNPYNKSAETGATTPIEIHEDVQMVDYLPAGSNIKKIFKVVLPMHIYTPDGYSIRQMPIPYSFNNDWHVSYGTFKADKIHEVNLQLNYTSEKEEIVIRQGTPLCLYVPFKREKIGMQVVNLPDSPKFRKKTEETWLKLKGQIRNAYFKNQF